MWEDQFGSPDFHDLPDRELAATFLGPGSRGLRSTVTVAGTLIGH